MGRLHGFSLPGLLGDRVVAQVVPLQVSALSIILVDVIMLSVCL